MTYTATVFTYQGQTLVRVADDRSGDLRLYETAVDGDPLGLLDRRGWTVTGDWTDTLEGRQADVVQDHEPQRPAWPS